MNTWEWIFVIVVFWLLYMIIGRATYTACIKASMTEEDARLNAIVWPVGWLFLYPLEKGWRLICILGDALGSKLSRLLEKPKNKN